MKLGLCLHPEKWTDAHLALARQLGCETRTPLGLDLVGEEIPAARPDEARRETSHVSARKPESPRASNARTPSVTEASFDPQRKTFAPSRRNRSTISSPVFRHPPVTTTTLSMFLVSKFPTTIIPTRSPNGRRYGRHTRPSHPSRPAASRPSRRFAPRRGRHGSRRGRSQPRYSRRVRRRHQTSRP